MQKYCRLIEIGSFIDIDVVCIVGAWQICQTRELERRRREKKNILINHHRAEWRTMARIKRALTTFTWATEYSRIIVNTIIAKRSVKLCDKSHRIHLRRAASISINIAAIQMNAVKNSNNKMNVRGKTATCSAVLSINSIRLHSNSMENPKSMSL